MIVHPIDAAPFFVRFGMGVFSAALVWLVATDYGSLLTRLWLRAWSVYPQRVIGAALGYALVGSTVGLLGLVHLLSAPLLAAMLALAVLLRLGTHLRHARQLIPTLRLGWQGVRAASTPEKLLFAASLFAVCTAIVAAALPAVWWDPLAYHLPIVALALKHGSFIYDAGIAQTGFPLLGEAAALPTYAIAGSAGAAMSTLGAGIVLALASGILADRVRAGAAPLATALVASSALWIWLAPSFYIDIPLALFSLCALTIAFSGSAGESFGEYFLSGAFAGAAAATKYTGLALVLLVLLIVLMRSRTQLVACAAAASGAAALALGWYARTYMATGDPLYPFLSAVLAHAHAPAPATQGHANVMQWFASVTPHFCGGGISLSDAFMLPIRLLTQPRSFCGDPGPALIPGFILFLAAPLLLRAARPWFLVSLVLTMIWFFSAQQWRFLVTAVCIVAALAAATTQSLQPRLRALVSTMLAVLCISGVAVNLLPSFIKAASNSVVPGYGYILGKQSGTQYLRARVDNFGAAAWLAANDPAAMIFALDDVRDYYFGPNVAWGNSPYPGGLRVDWAATPQQRYRGLVQSGYRYMVVNESPEYTHRTITNIDWGVLGSDEKAGVIRQVFSENDVVVYRFEK